MNEGPRLSDDVWAERDTTPDEIDAALRRLLRERHPANPTFAPARVLNLVVVVDRSWKGEISNRLARVGRYHASRTILCAVEEGSTTLDAVAVMSYDESPGGSLSVMHELVEIDMGRSTSRAWTRSSIRCWSRSCRRCCGRRTATRRRAAR